MGSLPRRSRRTSFRTPSFDSSSSNQNRTNKFLVNPFSDYLDRYKLAIVCSARSGSTKALGTTNLLLRAASEALRRPAPVLSPVQSGAATPLTNSLICRSSRTGSPLGALSAFAEPCTVSFNKTVDLIQSEHIIAARDCVKGKSFLAELEVEIVRDCESLRAFLSAAQVRRPQGLFICEIG